MAPKKAHATFTISFEPRAVESINKAIEAMETLSSLLMEPKHTTEELMRLTELDPPRREAQKLLDNAMIVIINAGNWDLGDSKGNRKNEWLELAGDWLDSIQEYMKVHRLPERKTEKPLNNPDDAPKRIIEKLIRLAEIIRDAHTPDELLRKAEAPKKKQENPG